jgi:hypothetical protein
VARWWRSIMLLPLTRVPAQRLGSLVSTYLVYKIKITHGINTLIHKKCFLTRKMELGTQKRI